VTFTWTTRPRVPAQGRGGSRGRGGARRAERIGGCPVRVHEGQALNPGEWGSVPQSSAEVRPTSGPVTSVERVCGIDWCTSLSLGLNRDASTGVRSVLTYPVPRRLAPSLTDEAERVE